jgi:hypothetical protein
MRNMCATLKTYETLLRIIQSFTPTTFTFLDDVKSVFASLFSPLKVSTSLLVIGMMYMGVWECANDVL